MILTAAVSLDTRGRIVVLVSYFQDFTKANSEQFTILKGRIFMQKISFHYKLKLMQRYTHVLFPQYVPINENFSLSVLKTSTIVLMDHAEMEEFAGMV